jgi:hypothetical protein
MNNHPFDHDDLSGGLPPGFWFFVAVASVVIVVLMLAN